MGEVVSLSRARMQRRMDRNRRAFEKLTEQTLCGGCHAWGYDPIFKNGVCEVCSRDAQTIFADHRRVILSSAEKHRIRRELNEHAQPVDPDDPPKGAA